MNKAEANFSKIVLWERCVWASPPTPTLHQKRYFMVKIRKLFSPVRQGLMGENAGYIEEKNTIVHKNWDQHQDCLELTIILYSKYHAPPSLSPFPPNPHRFVCTEELRVCAMAMARTHTQCSVPLWWKCKFSSGGGLVLLCSFPVTSFPIDFGVSCVWCK